MKEVMMDTFILICNVFAAIFVAVAAFAAWRSANQAKKATQIQQKSSSEFRRATQAQLISSLLDEYAKKEMLDALNNWKYFAITAMQSKGGYVEEFDTLKGFATSYETHTTRAGIYKANADRYNNLNSDRRRITHFFLKIARLWDKRLIDREVVELVAPKEKVEFWKYIVEPIEEAMNPHLYVRRDFEILQEFHGIDKPHPVGENNIADYIKRIS